MLTSMSAAEQKWLMRMLLKDMKFGLGQNRIFGIYHPDAQELYDVSNNLLKVNQKKKIKVVCVTGLGGL
jgi:DNA ligase-4